MLLKAKKAVDRASATAAARADMPVWKVPIRVGRSPGVEIFLPPGYCAYFFSYLMLRTFALSFLTALSF